MRQYLDLMDKVMQEGTLKKDRTGTGAKSVFGHHSKYVQNTCDTRVNTTIHENAPIHSQHTNTCEIHSNTSKYTRNT